MESQQYQRLNPMALAIAAGVAAIVLSLLIGLPMMGVGGMMGSHYGAYGQQGWMMGSYGNGSALGLGVMWLVGALIAALAGAIVAWVYNAVHATWSKEAAERAPTGESQLPNSR